MQKAAYQRAQVLLQAGERNKGTKGAQAHHPRHCQASTAMHATHSRVHGREKPQAQVYALGGCCGPLGSSLCPPAPPPRPPRAPVWPAQAQRPWDTGKVGHAGHVGVVVNLSRWRLQGSKMQSWKGCWQSRKRWRRRCGGP